MSKATAGGSPPDVKSRSGSGRPGFQVRMNGAPHGHGFADLRDAMEAAQIVKREHFQAIVGVYKPDGQMIAAID